MPRLNDLSGVVCALYIAIRVCIPFLRVVIRAPAARRGRRRRRGRGVRPIWQRDKIVFRASPAGERGNKKHLWRLIEMHVINRGRSPTGGGKGFQSKKSFSSPLRHAPIVDLRNVCPPPPRFLRLPRSSSRARPHLPISISARHPLIRAELSKLPSHGSTRSVGPLGFALLSAGDFLLSFKRVRGLSARTRSLSKGTHTRTCSQKEDEAAP